MKRIEQITDKLLDQFHKTRMTTEIYFRLSSEEAHALLIHLNAYKEKK